jgi:hypothetical protein
MDNIMTYNYNNTYPSPTLNLDGNSNLKKEKKTGNMPKTKIHTLNHSCRGINKNKQQCRNKAKFTIYCSRHIEFAVSKVLQIQKWWKLVMERNKSSKRGYGYEKRELCHNDEDFYTLNEIKNIPDKYFITYFEKNTKKLWAFDLRSLHNLFSIKSFINPYTRYTFTEKFIKNVDYFVKLYQKDCDFIIEDSKDETESFEEKVSRNTIDIFIEINSLGYHCDHKWVLNLPKNKLLKLIFDFQDIIYYRAYLNRHQIGDIFGCQVPFHELIHGIDNKSQIELVEYIMKKVKLIFTTNHSNKELGILLFLTALTFVSSEAMTSLEFLQQTNI